MIIEAILLSIVVGLIRGGKLSRFSKVNFKKMWILLFGIILQSFIIFLNGVEGIHVSEKIFKCMKELIIISYLILLVGILLNFEYRSLWLVLAGNILNFFVMIANHWKRPVLQEGVKLIGLDSLYAMLSGDTLSLYTAIDAQTKYPILGNIIVFSNPYPIPRILSIGDLIISFGLYTLIQEIMLSESKGMSNTLEFNPRIWK